MPHGPGLFLLLLLLIETALPVSVSYVLLRLPKIPEFKPCSGPSSLELHSTYKVSVAHVSIDSLPKHHEGHHSATSPAPLSAPGCYDNCSDPMTSSPIGSPCDCVLPMRVKLLLDAASYIVYPLVNEIEIEIATGIYLKQSQVRIMGVSTDVQNQDKTVLDVDLVPLAERFDNTTAMLTYERFLQKNVPLNANVFGNYELISIRYQGIAFPSSVTDMGGAPKSPDSGSFPETADLEKKNQRVNIRTIIGIALSGFVIILVCTGVLTIFINLRSIRKQPNGDRSTLTSSINNRTSLVFTVPSNITSSSSSSFVSNIAPSISTVKTFALGDLAEATSRFSSKRILGEGGFGRVYHGIFEDKTEAAIKLLTRDNQSREKEFVAEVEILSRLHHRNLVKLLGICIEGRTRCLVYEIVHNGSVESHLHGIDKKRGLLTWDARIKIALGAARGLAYLHEDSNPRVIHRDFKASNVLLENDFTPRVSDFGLAKEATEGSQHISTRVMGTFGYVAPEYAMTGHLLVKSDVYSYGVVLLELLTGRKPVDMSEPLGLQSLVTWARSRMAGAGARLDRLVDPTLAGNYNPDHAAKVAAIASVCIHPEVTHRPFMGEVVQALKLICNDSEERGTEEGTGGSQKEEGSSSLPDSEFRGDFGIDCCSWSGGGGGGGGGSFAAGYVTMDYSSGPMEQMGEKMTNGSRSGPLRMVRSLPAFYRVGGGSLSEHGQPFRRQTSGDLLYS